MSLDQEEVNAKRLTGRAASRAAEAKALREKLEWHRTSGDDSELRALASRILSQQPPHARP